MKRKNEPCVISIAMVVMAMRVMCGELARRHTLEMRVARDEAGEAGIALYPIACPYYHHLDSTMTTDHLCTRTI
jgi:hypothetical protein